MKLGLEEDQESVALLRFMSSDLSHLIPTDSIPTSLASSMGVPRVDLNGNENENDLPVDDATIPKPTAPVGQQIINFIFQKTKSLTTFTPSQVSISNGISKTRVALQGTFGISALKAVFKRRSIFKSQESELQNNQNIQKTPEVVEGSSRGYDSEGSWETVVEVDENLNEVRNPLTATFAEGQHCQIRSGNAGLLLIIITPLLLQVTRGFPIMNCPRNRSNQRWWLLMTNLQIICRSEASTSQVLL